ncbi:MAG: uroporphyrinogen decarboxylase family protein [Chloroflexi bacterium]|nr:uroporphyrinogen decarboxylase family protein [Chloroflexota bacterium]
MSRAELMTPMERLSATVAGLECDRVPVLPNIRLFGIRYCGLKFSDCLRDPTLYVRSQVRCLEEFGCDGAWDISMDGVSEALGAKLVEYDDDPPAPVVHPVRGIEDVERLREVNILESRRVRFLLGVVTELKAAVGPDVPVVAWAPAPLRTACMLRGLEAAYRDMIRQPQFAEVLVDACVQPSIQYAEALAGAGADFIWVSNPVADATAISRKHYEQLSVPFSRRMFSALRGKGIKVMYHFYGTSSDRLDLVASQGPDVLHGADMDLGEAKKLYGSRYTLMGNVRAITTMFQGTPAEVEKESIRCIREAGHGGRYILSAGAGLAPANPPENLAAMVAAAKKHGTYPLALH